MGFQAGSTAGVIVGICFAYGNRFDIILPGADGEFFDGSNSSSSSGCAIELPFLGRFGGR